VPGLALPTLVLFVLAQRCKGAKIGWRLRCEIAVPVRRCLSACASSVSSLQLNLIDVSSCTHFLELPGFLAPWRLERVQRAGASWSLLSLHTSNLTLRPTGRGLRPRGLHDRPLGDASVPLFREDITFLCPTEVEIISFLWSNNYRPGTSRGLFGVSHSGYFSRVEG